MLIGATSTRNILLARNNNAVAISKEVSQQLIDTDYRSIKNLMVHQLLDGATKEELEANGLTSNYVENGYGIYPINSNGVPFTVSYFASIGDAVADLAEDMAAEEKARATYEHLIDIAEDSELINILLFLRQREIVHYNRFKKLYEKYKYNK